MRSDSYAPMYNGDVKDYRSGDVHPLKLFELVKKDGRPLYTSAPMVRYSKLAFRETVLEYGVDLAWTPMILAKEFNRSVHARDSDFTTSPTDTPTILQFGVNSPRELSRATTLLAPWVAGVDLNCGCPQSWACAETLGAALMHKRELVSSMVTSAKRTMADLGHAESKTVSVKIRIHKDLRETVDFIKTVEAAGVDFITIHGRTRSQRSSEPVNVEAVKLLASVTTVPTILNGDVFTLSAAHSLAAATGVDGVMSARGILENPALFAGFDKCPWEAVEKFMNKVTKAPLPFKLVLHHLSEMCGSGEVNRGVGLLSKSERIEMLACNDMLELIDFLDHKQEIKRL